MSDYKFANQELVAFNLSPKVRGTGKVVGVSTTEMPVMGHVYMVEVEQTFCGYRIPNNEYPYRVISVPESCLEPIGKFFEGIL